MMNRRVCVDLFSGLGGFSESMFQRGWNVTRIDNDEGFSHIPETTIADVFTMNPKDLPQRPDILVISPPCECFSLMAVNHYWENGRPKNDKTRFAISLVKRSLWIKDQIKPNYWVIENPNGMMVRVLGTPNHRTWWAAWYSDEDHIVRKLKELGFEYPPLKPTNIWGIAPAIDWPSKPTKYIRAPAGSKLGIQNSKLTAAERSLVPFKFGEALAIAIEEDRGGQTTL